MILLLLFLDTPCVLWDLSSPPRDQTCAVSGWTLTTGPQGIPWYYFLKYFLELNYKTHSPHKKMLLSLLFTHGHHLTGQFSSVIQSCPTLCNPMDCSMPGLPAHHQLQELTQTHVHWVSEATQPSHPLSSPSPPALNLSQHQGLFQSDWSVLAIVQHTTVFRICLGLLPGYTE